jgi:hypothetical protein
MGAAPTEKVRKKLALELAASESTDYSDIKAWYAYPLTLDWIVDVYFSADDATATKMILDSGSSNLAVAIESCTNCGKASTDLALTLETPEQCIEVTYGSGAWFGYEIASTYVGLTSIVSTDVTLAGITDNEDFFEGGASYSGILGMAYEGIANGYSSSTCDDSNSRAKSSSDDEVSATPLMYALDEAGAIDSNMFAVAMCGDDAQVSIGGVDDSFYKGDISYAETQKTFGEYYGYYLVYMSGLSVDGSSVDLEGSDINQYGGLVVDTGTTLNYLPSSVVKSIEEQVEGTVSSVSSSFFEWESCISKDEMDDFPDVVYTFAKSDEEGAATFDVTLKPEHYLMDYSDCYYWGFESSTLGIFGNIAMRNKMLVFDITMNQVGFAEGVCSDNDSAKGIMSAITNMVGKVAGQVSKKSSSTSGVFSGMLSAMAVMGTVLASAFVAVKHFHANKGIAQEEEGLLAA